MHSKKYIALGILQPVFLSFSGKQTKNQGTDAQVEVEDTNESVCTDDNDLRFLSQRSMSSTSSQCTPGKLSTTKLNSPPRCFVTHNLFIFCVSNTNMAVLRAQLEIKADIRNIQRDVQYLHYLITRNTQHQNVGVQQRDERITQYIPCSSMEELRNLNRKLDRDAEFMRHSVSCWPIQIC